VHVMRHQRFHLRGVIARKTEAGEDRAGHFDAFLDVAVEADAVRHAEHGWLAHVVQQRAQGQRRRGAIKFFRCV